MPNLAGFWQYGGQPDSSLVCDRIMDAAAPRSSGTATGSKGIFNGGSIAIGRRTPAIERSSPGSELDVQPFLSPDGRYCLVADIQLDNRDEVMDVLGLDSRATDAFSDTGILMLAWERWREQCLARIVGAFAFAVWDAQERVLFLARDHAGERPLYYHSGSSYFAFASTPRALLQCPGIDSSLDEMHLALGLCGIPDEQSRSYLKAVSFVAPGHCVVARPGTVTESAYWRLEDVPDIRFARDEDYVEAFLQVFDEAVRCRLQTNGKPESNIATELSGGLDSSSVCATAARLLAAQGRTLTAFTSVPSVDLAGRFADRYMPDEGPAAAEVARLYPNIEHKLITSAGSNLLRELQRTHPELDRPMANPLNQVWINLIQEQASRDGARVLLNGQRGNITISTPGLLRDVFQRGNFLSALRLAHEHKRSWAPLLKNAFTITRNTLLPRSLRPSLDPRFQETTLDGSAINPQLATELGMLDRYREFILRPGGDFRSSKWRDFNQFDVGDFHIAGQNSWQIDGRDPTSDKRVRAFCLGIPMEQYVVGGVNCSLIRRAMRGRLPESTLNQPRKGLQSGDWYESLTAILPQMKIELARIEGSPLAQRMLDLPRLRETLEHWPGSAKDAVLDEARNHDALARGLACGYFLREFEGVE